MCKTRKIMVVRHLVSNIGERIGKQLHYNSFLQNMLPMLRETQVRFLCPQIKNIMPDVFITCIIIIHCRLKP